MLAPMTKPRRTKRNALADGEGRRVFAPRNGFGRAFDTWIRGRGFRRMEDVAAAVGYSYDAVVKWRRGDREPGARARREVDGFIDGSRDLLVIPEYLAG